MTKPQIVVRIPPYLLEKLNNYAQQTGTSKTEVVVGALAHYLGCVENLPLNQRVAELEARTAVLEALLKAS
ncbi:DNA-binding domain-containing protein [Nostoc sp.]|uniref:DNA-binding domain-containing protein n=1 Tax=Nostoc sp. TaxID=1180 RepID=UPI002FF81F9F